MANQQPFKVVPKDDKVYKIEQDVIEANKAIKVACEDVADRLNEVYLKYHDRYDSLQKDDTIRRNKITQVTQLLTAADLLEQFDRKYDARLILDRNTLLTIQSKGGSEGNNNEGDPAAVLAADQANQAVDQAANQAVEVLAVPLQQALENIAAEVINSSRSLKITISNSSTSELDDYKCYHKWGHDINTPPHHIPSGTKAVLQFAKRKASLVGLAGILSYKVGSHNVRLVIVYRVPLLNGNIFIRKNFLAVGIYSSNADVEDENNAVEISLKDIYGNIYRCSNTSMEKRERSARTVKFQRYFEMDRR